MTNSNPEGRGGTRRRITPNKARGKTSHRKGGNKPPKKSSGGGSKSMVVIGFLLLGIPATAILSLVGYLLHGHGFI